MKLKRHLAFLITTALLFSSAVPVFADSATLPMKQGKLSDALKYGDVNLDGEVSKDDAAQIVKAVVGNIKKQDAHVTNGDMNKDGNLSIRDALLLLQDQEEPENSALGYEKNLSEINYYIPEDFSTIEEPLSFPGADGFGKYTTGGQGGKVIEVTNLNDSGPGSLREALSQTYPRIIVFKVSGTIMLKSDIRMNSNNGNVTIAGQTAPGDGITLMNAGFIISDADNIIMRYIRLHLGDLEGRQQDCLWINGCENVMIDHCSALWGTDETISVRPAEYTDPNRVSDNVTLQWCLICESINNSGNVNYDRAGNHAMASIVAGSYGSKYTLHHNYYTAHRSRMPALSNVQELSAEDYSEDPDNRANHEFINNLSYNWNSSGSGKDSPIDDSTGTLYNYSVINAINNTYVAGGLSKGNNIFEISCMGSRLYASGNSMNGVIPEDQIHLATFENDVLQSEKNPHWVNSGKYLTYEEFEVKEPFAFSKMSNIQTASDSAEDIVEYVGASLSRDTYDQALINEYLDRTSPELIDYITDSAGWPGGIPNTTLGESYVTFVKAQLPKGASYPAYIDSDHDGISDSYEDFMGLDKTNPDDAAQKYANNQNFTNLDIFLQFLVENPEAAIAH